jgi:DnaT-like ssDNA binding protein
MANIDKSFAEEQIAEFILYWQDNGQALSSWNTKFLQYIKRQWAYLGNKPNGDSTNITPYDKARTSHETQQRSRRQGSTRNRDIAAELSDRSWAD